MKESLHGNGFQCACQIDCEYEFIKYADGKYLHRYWYKEITYDEEGVLSINVFPYDSIGVGAPRTVYKTNRCKKCKQECIHAGKELEKDVYCFNGYEPITNRDKLNRLSNDELAKKLEERPWCDENKKNSVWCIGQLSCYRCISEWMEKETEI